MDWLIDWLIWWIVLYNEKFSSIRRLIVYVYEYLHHMGAKNAADTFLNEVRENRTFLRLFLPFFWFVESSGVFSTFNDSVVSR